MTRNALSEKSRDPEHTISDRDTKRTYKASIKRFCTWTKENGYTREDVLSNPQPYLQQYTDNLKAHGLSAATIHTYIAPCDYYLTRIKQEPDYRSQLQENLKAYFREHHDPNGELDQAAYNRFCLDMTRNQGIYQMRGEAKKLAEANERPTTYDRVALMAVSTLHLAHWRLDVTITNYLSYKV